MDILGIGRLMDKFANKVGETRHLKCKECNRITTHASISYREYLEYEMKKDKNMDSLFNKNPIGRFVRDVYGKKADVFDVGNIVTRPFECEKCGKVRLL